MVSLRSTAITAVSSLLRAPPPLRAASLLSASSFCDLCLFDYHLRAASRVPYTGLLRAHAILMPDAEQPASGLPLPLSRSGREIPVLTSLYANDTSSMLHFRSSSRSVSAHFLWTFPCLAESSAHVRPYMWFLFVGPKLCPLEELSTSAIRLPSDSTSRWTPLPSANGSCYRVRSGLSPPGCRPCRAHKRRPCRSPRSAWPSCCFRISP